jgi:hypothetical protein
VKRETKTLKIAKMETKFKFENATETKGGFKVKDIKFNTAANLYLGMVADPLWTRPDRPFITGSWNKLGKCINRNRPELDLILK